MSVSCECFMLGRCLCDVLIPCLEESYQLWCVTEELGGPGPLWVVAPDGELEQLTVNCFCVMLMDVKK